MPKLLLIQPPVEDFYDTDIRLQPIGLCCLKAAVQKYLDNWQVTVLDFHHGHGRKSIAIPKELADLKPFYRYADKGPFRTFHQYFRFGADYSEIGRQVALLAPDLVGISSLFSPYYREVLRTAAAIKAHLDLPILVGGSHVSAAAETLLADEGVDFVIRGEGERPLVEFLKVWQAGGQDLTDLAGVANLGYKKNGALRFNPVTENYPLEELPIADFSDLSPQRYLHGRQPICFIITSRGCPHRCSFCSVRLTFGRQYRRRSPSHIIDEMEIRYAAGYRVFDFEDDNLTFDQKEFRQLCRLIIDQFQDRPIQLLAMNGVSYASLDRPTLELMKKAGFTHLNLALVSSNAEVLRSVNRPHSVDRFAETVTIAAKLDFRMVAYQILGLPSESLDSMIRTMVVLARLPVLIGVSIFYLTPNSPIAADFPPMTEKDIFLARSTAMARHSEKCRREQLYTLFITARILNFIKAMPVTGQAESIRQILSRSHNHARTETGVMILRRLLNDKILEAQDNITMVPVESFQSELFFQVWQIVGSVCTQEGKEVRLES